MGQIIFLILPTFFGGQNNLQGGHFWAMGRSNLLDVGGQNNLLYRWAIAQQVNMLFEALKYCRCVH